MYCVGICHNSTTLNSKYECNYSSDMKKIGIIVGCVVGGIVVIVIIAVSISVIVKKNK